MQALPSTIDAVTVYRKGARVTRLAKLDAGSPERTVRITGLPLALDDDTVRARVIGASASVTELRVTLSVESSEEQPEPPEEAGVVRAHVAVLEQSAVVKQIERDLERLGKLEIQARAVETKGEKGASIPDTPIAARLELLDARQKLWSELHTALEDARGELREREREFQELEEALARVQTVNVPKPGELRKCAVISLRGENLENPLEASTVALDYFIDGAQWAPSYAAHLDPDGSAATIGSRAIVAQNTGEDWTGVRLTLVTAAANTQASLEKLASLRIGRRQQAPKSSWRPPPVGTDSLFDDYRRAFGTTQHPMSSTGAPSGGSGAVGSLDDFKFGGAADVVVSNLSSIDSFDDELMLREESAEAGVFPSESLPPPPPAPAAKSASAVGSRRSHRKRRTQGPPPGGANRGGGGSAQHAPEVAEIAAIVMRENADLRNYRTLEIGGPQSSHPGKLVRVASSVRWRAELKVQWSESFVLEEIVRVACDDAASVADAHVPDGFVVPQALDYDYSFAADGSVDIPSDGGFHSLALSKASGPSSLWYQVCPRETCDVFRVARLNNPLEGPMLAGPIDVYLGGEYLLATKVPFTPPGGAVRFGLGVEQGIEAVRNTSFRDDSAGLLGGSRELHHQIRIEVQNHLDREIELEVRERVPVTREDEEDIRVEVGPAVPAWSPFKPGDDEPSHPTIQGGHRWTEKLAARGKTELKVSYVIRISSKHELVGGNRRER